jgi:hypothetical protein
MSVDDPPEEGFVRGASFLHPSLRIAFTAPRDFRLYNDHDGVLASAPTARCSISPARAARSRARWTTGCATACSRRRPTSRRPRSAAQRRRSAPAARLRHGLGQVRYVIIRRPDGICFFNLMSDGPDRDRRINVLVEATRSFRDLSEAEAPRSGPIACRSCRAAHRRPCSRRACPIPTSSSSGCWCSTASTTPAGLALREQVKIVEPVCWPGPGPLMNLSGRSRGQKKRPVRRPLS